MFVGTIANGSGKGDNGGYFLVQKGEMWSRPAKNGGWAAHVFLSKKNLIVA
jgi:hypothetical protein